MFGIDVLPSIDRMFTLNASMSVSIAQHTAASSSGFRAPFTTAECSLGRAVWFEASNP